MIPQIKLGDLLNVYGEGWFVTVNPEEDQRRHGDKIKMVLRCPYIGASRWEVVYEALSTPA